MSQIFDFTNLSSVIEKKETLSNKLDFVEQKLKETEVLQGTYVEMRNKLDR